MRLHVQGAAEAAEGPVLVLVRHASVADTMLASVLLSEGFGLRYVLKRELLWDLCLDVVGNRLPNHFVRRDPGDGAERDAVRRLSGGLAVDEGVLLYPEGTRYSEPKRERAVARLADGASAALAARAALFRNVLPPRTGGFLALLDGAPDTDVVVCAHHGLEGAARMSDLLGGALLGRQVHVRFQRFPSGTIPQTAEARVEWLYDRWAEVDRFVTESMSSERGSA